jgi:hypothetical protein
MSTALLRLGLWTVILFLALYVLAAVFPDEPVGQIVDEELLPRGIAAGVVIAAGGAVLRVVGKGAKAVVKNRCQVCRTPIPPGAIYCRAHLRTILHEEDEKTHMTRIKR